MSPMWKTFRVLSIVFLVSMIFASSPTVTAQNVAIQNSTPLSFRKSFTLAQGSQALASYQGTGVNLQYSATLTYGESLVLATQSSTKYAQASTSGTLTINESNDLALVQLSGNAAVTFSLLGLTTGQVNYPIDIEYAIPVTAGNYQDVVLGTFSVANAQVGPVNVQVNMQPVIVWTPYIYGGYSASGPATITPSSMSLSGSSTTATISFSASQPVDVYLNSPRLTLQSLSLLLYFPVLVSGLQVADPSVTLVNAGTYSTYAATANLISFDPDYYTLYTQLQSSFNTLSSTLQQLQGFYSSLSSSVQGLQQSVGGLSTQVNTVIGEYANTSSTLSSLKSELSSVSSIQQQLQQSINGLARQLAGLTGTPTSSTTSITATPSSVVQTQTIEAGPSLTSPTIIVLSGVSASSLIVAIYSLLQLRKKQ